MTIVDSPVPDSITKCKLISDIAKTFDVIGWFSPYIVVTKVLLQRIWERRIDWDDAVPSDLLNTWRCQKHELPLLSSKEICCSHFNFDSSEYHVGVAGSMSCLFILAKRSVRYMTPVSVTFNFMASPMLRR